MVLVRKRIKPIQAEFIELPSEMVISQVDSLERFKAIDKHGQICIETPNEVYVLKGPVAFRYEKPSAKPHIINVESLELNPDHFTLKVTLTKDQLFSFARRQQIILFEAADGYYIPNGEVIFQAKKERR